MSRYIVECLINVEVECDSPDGIVAAVDDVFVPIPTSALLSIEVDSYSVTL